MLRKKKIVRAKIRLHKALAPNRELHQDSRRAKGDWDQAPPPCRSSVGPPEPLSYYLHPICVAGCRSPDGPVGGMHLSYLHSADFIGHASVSLCESLEP